MKKAFWTRADLQNIFNAHAQRVRDVAARFPGFSLMEYELALDRETKTPVWVFTADEAIKGQKLCGVPKRIGRFPVRVDYKWAG